MKIALVTDSTAYLSKEEIQAMNVHVLPLSVIFGQTSYQEGVDIEANEFYEKVKSSSDFPTSSQPAVGYVLETFESLAKDYDAIISIHLSSKISGTFQTVAMVGEQVADAIQVFPVDSGITCSAQANAVRLAHQFITTRQYTPEQIVEKIYSLMAATHTYFVVDDLSNLQRGGRLSSSAAAIGALLKIKPILTLIDKKIAVFEKIRTQQKAVKRIEQVCGETMTSPNGKGYMLSIVHANCPEKAEEWKAHFQKQFPELSIRIDYFGPVIGTHLGEGALGFIWNPTLEQYR